MQTQTTQEMHKAAINEGLIGVLDIGTSKVVSMLLRLKDPKGFQDEDIETLLGTDKSQILGAATTRSHGVRQGQIQDATDTERAIRTAVYAATKMANTKFKYALVCTSTPDVSNLDQIRMILDRCEWKLAGFAHSAHASGVSCLTDDEQAFGAACIDMGGGSTGISVFHKRRMISVSTIPSGGDAVTADISKQLQVSLRQAERIKTFYGGASLSGLDEGKMFEIRSDPDELESTVRNTSQRDLVEIMRPRLVETLETVGSHLDDAGFERRSGRKVILTGGASRIPDFDRLASEILGEQVSLATPFRPRGLPKAATGAGFSASVGLTMAANEADHELWQAGTLTSQGGKVGRIFTENRLVGLDDLDRAINNSPNAEIIEVDPKTHLARAVPISNADSDFLRDARNRMKDALQLFGKIDADDNQYRGLKAEIETLERGLKDYPDRPLRLHDIAQQIIRRVEHKERLGECPEARTDAIIADFKSELSGVAIDLRQQDLKVREVVLARANEKLQNIDHSPLDELPDFARVISKTAETKLAKELREDAKTASSLSVDPTTRSNALYRFASRTFRLMSIGYKSMRLFLKEGVSLWRDAMIAVAAYPALAEVLRFLLALF